MWFTQLNRKHIPIILPYRFVYLRLPIVASALLALSLHSCGPEQQAQEPLAVEAALDYDYIDGGIFSDDDSRIAYLREEGEAANVYEYVFADGQTVQRTFSDTASYFPLGYFPNSSDLLVAARVGGYKFTELFRLNADDEVEDLTPWDAAQNIFIGWSTGGDSLLFATNQRSPSAYDLYALVLSSNELVEVFRSDEAYSIHELSPNGEWLLLSVSNAKRANKLMLYNLRTRAKRYIVGTEMDAYYQPQGFSTNGQWVYYLQDRWAFPRAVMAYSVAGDSTQALEQPKGYVRFFKEHPSGQLLFGMDTEARMELMLYDNSDKLIDFSSLPKGDVQRVEFDHSGKLATVVLNSSLRPKSIYLLELETGHWQLLASGYEDNSITEGFVEGKHIWLENDSGHEVPALLFKPFAAGQGAERKAILWVHSGPVWQERFEYSPLRQLLLNRGYTVLAVNYTGSVGYARLGTKDIFTPTHKQATQELVDLHIGQQFLVKQMGIKPEHIGVLGMEYGGYLALEYAAHYPDDAACTAYLFGVIDLYRALKELPDDMALLRERLIEIVGHPDSMKAHFVAHSPYYNAPKLTQPLMLQHLQGDPFVNDAQFDEFVEMLRAQGTEVDYLHFESNGIELDTPEQKQRSYSALLSFFEKHL